MTQCNACLAYLGRKFGLWGRTPAEEIECEELLCEIMDLRNALTTFSYQYLPRQGDNAVLAKQFLEKITGKHGALHKFERKLNIANANCAFLVGDHATAPDFHLFVVLHQCFALAYVAGDAERLGLPQVFASPATSELPAPDARNKSEQELPMAPPSPRDEQMSLNFGNMHLLSSNLDAGIGGQNGGARFTFPRLAEFYQKFASLPQNQRYLKSRLHTKMPFNNRSAHFGAVDFSSLQYEYSEMCKGRKLPFNDDADEYSGIY